MAQLDASAMDLDYDQTSAPSSYATPLTTMPQDAGDDSDEWEYEYSTTETETFLLTLDLTNPDLDSDRVERSKQAPLRTRWMNPGLGRNRPGKYTKPATYSTIAGSMAEADDMLPGEYDPEVEDDDEEEEVVAGAGSAASSPVPDQVEEKGELQIVDLHSDNPLISYNGQQFSCQWASNIGTEMLFMAHDRESVIPVLRKLNGGVDLLAANSARLISNKLELEPRKRKRSPERAFVRGSNIHHTQYMIPVGSGAFAKRKDQAVFLERLIGMKAARGETDNVTIVAERRVSNNKWKTRYAELRNVERKQLNDVVKGKKRGVAMADKEKAKKRLQEMDEEDERLAKTEPSVGKKRALAKVERGRQKKALVGAPAGPTKARRGRPPTVRSHEEVVYENMSKSVEPAGEVNPLEDGNGGGPTEDIMKGDGDEDIDLYSAEE